MYFSIPGKTIWLSVGSRWKFGRREAPRERDRLKGWSGTGVCVCVPMPGKSSQYNLGKCICVRSCDILLKDKFAICLAGVGNLADEVTYA
jgi:hypothetical protein